ncbi:YdhK family protein [Staphylococcus simulans]|uniref:YdhK family protein n=1 Tax=Staphylococcus simulans TaxID=1286 RepID=UPI001E549F67|nr:YdhK family protein [Staphylococcus simulans]MCD8915543.1 YdhK family protein [Staphylococcus simulans]
MLYRLGAAVIASGLLLTACGTQEQSDKQSEQHQMEHNQKSDAPKQMTQAKDSQFKKGDKVILKEGHMPGMMNAEGKVKGVYHTKVYQVSYEPTNGGKKVNHHKWVVNEEIKDAPKEGFKSGDQVTLEADHMKGMKDAKATIDKVEDKNVYMVDYKDTDNGKIVKNHKWMTEDELEADQ